MSNTINIEQVQKLIQIYMLQGVYSNISSNSDSSSNYSALFSIVLENMLKDVTNKTTSTDLNKTIQKTNEDTAQISVNSARSSSVSQNIMEAIDAASEKYGIDGDLIKAIVKNESSFNPNAVSSCGAQGLMQLMPSTAKSLGVSNSFDVSENLDGGTRYFKRLLESFNGNVKLALSAYNGGISRMNRLGVDTEQEISAMPTETVNYVSKVIKSYNEYKNSY